jgi:hypothetical protein
MNGFSLIAFFCSSFDLRGESAVAERRFIWRRDGFLATKDCEPHRPKRISMLTAQLIHKYRKMGFVGD